MHLVSLCCIFVLKHKCDNKGYKRSMSCLIVLFIMPVTWYTLVLNTISVIKLSSESVSFNVSESIFGRN